MWSGSANESEREREAYSPVLEGRVQRLHGEGKTQEGGVEAQTQRKKRNERRVIGR